MSLRPIDPICTNMRAACGREVLGKRNAERHATQGEFLVPAERCSQSTCHAGPQET